jgi:hypothetical protein
VLAGGVLRCDAGLADSFVSVPFTGAAGAAARAGTASGDACAGSAVAPGAPASAAPSTACAALDARSGSEVRAEESSSGARAGPRSNITLPNTNAPAAAAHGQLGRGRVAASADPWDRLAPRCVPFDVSASSGSVGA